MPNSAGVTHGSDIHDTALTFVQYCHTMSRVPHAATELGALMVRGVDCGEVPPSYVSYFGEGVQK